MVIWRNRLQYCTAVRSHLSVVSYAVHTSCLGYKERISADMAQGQSWHERRSYPGSGVKLRANSGEKLRAKLQWNIPVLLGWILLAFMLSQFQ